MKIIAVASGKGGTGKSCVAAYTGAALARMGKKTLLMELGYDSRSLDLILGISESALFTVHDVLNGTCEAGQAVMSNEENQNLHILLCSLTPWNVTVGKAEFQSIISALPGTYDFIVLDGVDFSAFPPALCDCVLNVVNPETLSIRAASTMTNILHDGGAKDVRLIINNVPVQILPMAGIEDFDDIIDAVGARLIAVIPASPKLRYAANNAADIDGDSITPKIFERLAARLEGQNLPLLVR